MFPFPGPPWLLVLDALAVYRLTRFVTDDHLPFGPVRDAVRDRWPQSLVAEWMECPWCAGIGMGSLVLVLHHVGSRWWPGVAAVLAFSAITGLLSTWEHHR
jgi:hypothetical protein